MIQTKTVGTLDRRRESRKKSVENIKYSSFSEDGRLSSEGIAKAIDFSPMGIKIQTTEEFLVNTKIVIEVFFKEETHRYTGEIAWIKKITDKEFMGGVRILFKKVNYTTPSSR